ncbi:hypothetical protein BD779DRAFT_1534654 [Infundibulicybe gibba]|nr:hypothetical protein BD779DRAFT_1534654 [Infundibulicybe gibba]
MPRQLAYAIQRGRTKVQCPLAQGNQYTAEEAIRVRARRIAKAERDERIDITLALTPSKTYMGGFTRPRDIRVSNWFQGGRYVSIGKKYEPPPDKAYESHTVFLLESRYNVKFGPGRVDALEHILEVCREGDFQAVLARYNSLKAPPDALQAMDNARWPWGAQRNTKRVVWWDKGEDPMSIARESRSDYLLSPSSLHPPLDNTQNIFEALYNISIRNPSPAPASPPTPAEIRSQYLHTLTTTPFWRPLLTLTVSTRPLALSLLRLSRSLPRGLPFYAAMSPHDRKSHLSYSTRMRCLRLARMQTLVRDLAQLLAGERGGLPGIRFAASDMGRGVHGEGLEAQIPWRKRVIRVGVGNWYSRAEEVKEGFRNGRRLSEANQVIPWSRSEEQRAPPFIAELQELEKLLHKNPPEPGHHNHIDHRDTVKRDIGQEIFAHNQERARAKARTQEILRQHSQEIAAWRARRNGSVIYP